MTLISFSQPRNTAVLYSTLPVLYFNFLLVVLHDKNKQTTGECCILNNVYHLTFINIITKKKKEKYKDKSNCYCALKTGKEKLLHYSTVDVIKANAKVSFRNEKQKIETRCIELEIFMTLFN